MKNSENKITSTKKITQQINASILQRNRIVHKINKIHKHKRQARTRTLIQIGGLFHKAELNKFFNLELGEDLQLESLNKAAQILGMFLELNTSLKSEKLNHWQLIGEKKLKEGKLC